MAERSDFRRPALLYHNHLDNMEMQGAYDRAVDYQAPPPYDHYDEDQAPPSYGAHLHDGRDMGRLDYGIRPNREPDFLELDPPQSNGRGRHFYNIAAYGDTNDDTHFGDRYHNGYRMHDMGGHRRQLGRDINGVRVYRCNREFIAAMDALTPDRDSRHGHYENPYLSPSRDSGLGPPVRRGIVPHPHDFDDDLNLDVRGTRGLRREMHDAGVQRRHSSEDDLEDDAMGNGFRAGHRRTDTYRSRYGSRPGYLSEDYLENDDFEDDFRGRGRGQDAHRSGYRFEDEFDLIDEDVRTGPVRATEYPRRRIRQKADNRAFEMERHEARRGHQLRGRSGRHFEASLDDDDSEEPRHISDSEDERIQQSIQRRVLENRRDSVSRPISDSEDERSEQPIPRRIHGHRTPATSILLSDRLIDERLPQRREHETRARPAATHPFNDPPNRNLEDHPRTRHTSPHPPHNPSTKRARPRAIRPPAFYDTSHPDERPQPEYIRTSSGTHIEVPLRIHTDIIKRANPPTPLLEATVLKNPTPQASTDHADREPQRVDQHGDAGSSRDADGRAAKGRQPSGRDGLGDSGSTSTAGVEMVRAGAFSDSSDDRCDTPGSSSSDDGDGRVF
ncbi:MAG: hypothetical protein Q9161_002027 [Pseudevernia consocians]